MDIRQFLDSTYLKTATQAGVSDADNKQIAKSFIQEAIDEKFKLIMIRPEMVSLAKQMVTEQNSKVTIGTVINFPKGDAPLDEMLAESKKAIADGADDLDYVVDYEAFQRGELHRVKTQVIEGTALGLNYNKIVKWIIEVAALSDHEIIQLAALIKNCIISNFKESSYDRVFVKSSTGFYKTEGGKPNGATVETIKLMLENSFPLPVKAAGGVRTYEEAKAMVALGVKRIGTSSAKVIAEGGISKNEY